MPRKIENHSYSYFVGKLVILGVFILALVVLIPFFYGWINGKAHQRICEAVGIGITWSCGLIVRDPLIFQGYIQLSTPQDLPEEQFSPSPVPED